jgi:3-oxoacyl-[acyl-carrier-protein] synthase-3
MKYQRVCLESVGYVLPGEVVTSVEIEQRIADVYERLRLPEGRLELMTGIRERRLWSRGATIFEPSARSARLALEAASLDAQHVGALVHGSVCRDRLEPATACSVHHAAGLPPQCVVYDTSNACLGIVNGMLQIANMIELGQVRAGIAVGTENSRGLLETTIEYLKSDRSLTRQSIKPAFASLTIGSASIAVLLVERSLSKTGNTLVGGAARAESRYHALCQSGSDAAGANMQPLMDTDSEQLLRSGVETGAQTFEEFLQLTGWSRDTIARTICHQVGTAHRRATLDALRLPADNDFVTYPVLGNTGSAALPMTLALAAEQGFLRAADRVALLGIGSGINCVMLAVDWQASLVKGEVAAADDECHVAAASATIRTPISK